ncbi:hypothetical protein GCM10009527_028180 [Actinomadura nitritigenes]
MTELRDGEVAPRVGGDGLSRTPPGHRRLGGTTVGYEVRMGDFTLRLQITDGP